MGGHVTYQRAFGTFQPLAFSYPFVPDRLPPLLRYMVCILHACSVVTCNNIPTNGASDVTKHQPTLDPTEPAEPARTSPDP